jgi:hypothetical protein
MPAADLSRVIVTEYGNYFRKVRQKATQSAIDLGRIAPLATAVNSLADALLGDLGTVAGAVSLARDHAQKFEYPEYIDLGDFARQLAQRLPHQPKVQTAIASLQATLDSGKPGVAVLANATAGTAVQRATGLSIYFPRAEDYAPDYSDLLYSRHGRWKAFLEKMFAS